MLRELQFKTVDKKKQISDILQYLLHFRIVFRLNLGQSVPTRWSSSSTWPNRKPLRTSGIVSLCPSCHPTNKCQSIEGNSKHRLQTEKITDWNHPFLPGSRGNGHCSPYACSLTPVPFCTTQQVFSCVSQKRKSPNSWW